jgi:hypothetical protein
MALSDKAEHHKLFMCETPTCRVISFIGEYCPGCTAEGLLLREIPMDFSFRREEIRRELDSKRPKPLAVVRGDGEVGDR